MGGTRALTAAELATLTAAPGEMKRSFDFDDISLIPRVVSRVSHRADVSPGVSFGPARLKLPIVGSPMPDVCGREMVAALAQVGALGILHRFMPAGEEAAMFAQAARSAGSPEAVGAAVGVTGDFNQRFEALYQAGCRIVCLDTANGGHEQVGRAIQAIKAVGPDVFLVAGNVASAEAFHWLEEQGADAIRVGIAGGSVCETRNETGVFVPTPFAVVEAVGVRRRALIVADGGVRMPADLCKLLALGADVVMLGSALAGTREALGRTLVVDGKTYKIMRGAASFSVQQEAGMTSPQYVEGAETLVPYKGGVRDVIQRYLAGLQSSMSYLDARSLEDYRRNATFIRHC